MLAAISGPDASDQRGISWCRSVLVGRSLVLLPGSNLTHALLDCEGRRLRIRRRVEEVPFVERGADHHPEPEWATGRRCLRWLVCGV
jgi:hypothetical protein